MGNYTTAKDVRALYPPLNEHPKITDPQIEFYISAAENHINGVLAMRYTLPFSATPPIVGTIAAEYSLMNVLDRMFTQAQPNKNDWRAIRKKELQDILTSIGSGTTLLLNSSYSIISQTTVAAIDSDTKAYVPTFTHLHPSRQEIDPDRLTNESENLKYNGIVRTPEDY